MSRLARVAFGTALTCGMLALNQNCGDAGFVRLGADAAGLNSVASGSRLNAPLTAGLLKNWDDPFPPLARAENCLDDGRYSLCVADRDPVSVNGSAFTPRPFAPDSAIEDQEHAIFNGGINVPATAPQNRHFHLETPGLTAVGPLAGGDFKYRFRANANHDVGQLAVFYWINRERTFFLDRVGHFYFDADTLKRHVTIRASVDQANAFYEQTDDSVNFGYLETAGQKAELALDASVVVHEAGHGNFHSANRGGGVDHGSVCRSDGYCYCPSKNGCMLGLDEGIADIHSFIFFNGDAAVGRFATNSMEGLRDPARDLQNGETVDSLYGTSANSSYPRGEIHNMGRAYAAIWYAVWSEAKSLGTERDVEVLFSEHLTDLTANETFQSAFRVIHHNIDTLFPSTGKNADRGPALKQAFGAAYARLHLNTQ